MDRKILLITSALVLCLSTERGGQAAAQGQVSVPVMPVAPTQQTTVYVRLPSTPTVEYYGSVPTNTYVYYGGYFWYPESNAGLLEGYEPLYWNGQYWYASRIHPHQVYVEKRDLVYILPEEPRGILD
jgi:hypothetical protein